MNISINEYKAMCAQREIGRRSLIKDLQLPDYTFTEEVLNCVTHALGALLGAVGFFLCMRLLLPAGHWIATASMAFFCTAMVILYTNSSLYHGWQLTRAKKVFQIIDHCSIFLLIAGTYTPFTLMVMGETVGRAIFVIVSLVSVFGIMLNVIDMKKYRRISMACYLITGWCIVFAYSTISAALTVPQLMMLIGGGVAYTVGAVLYGLGVRIRYMHTIWHLFVLAGSLLHFLCLYSFIAAHFS